MIRVGIMMLLRFMADFVETVMVVETVIVTETIVLMMPPALFMQLRIAPLGHACRRRRWRGPGREDRLALVVRPYRRLACSAHDGLTQPTCLCRHRGNDGILGQPGLDMRDP